MIEELDSLRADILKCGYIDPLTLRLNTKLPMSL